MTSARRGDLRPAGSPFFNFNLPVGASPSGLTIAWWDASSGQWMPLKSTIDLEAGTITAQIKHFTSFAVLARQPIASFSLSALLVTPVKAGLKENVTVSIMVANSGDAPGSCDVPLKVDNALVETKK